MTVRWGVIGTGGIARSFVGDCTAAGIVFTAVGSRTREHAEAFAAEFGIEWSHGSYEDLVADERIDASRIDRWASEMDPAARRLVAERLDRLATFYGYSMVDAAALEPLHGRKGPLIRGRDLKRRLRDFADLDLLTRMPVPIFEQYYNPRHFWLVENETGEPPETTPRLGPPPSTLERGLRRLSSAARARAGRR